MALLIDFLDLLDGDLDLEPEEDCCPAGDDDPASSTARGQHEAMEWPGDPADAEDEPDCGAGKNAHTCAVNAFAEASAVERQGLAILLP